MPRASSERVRATSYGRVEVGQVRCALAQADERGVRIAPGERDGTA